MKDIKYGIELARQVASIDIGQTVVVKNMIPIAENKQQILV